MLKFKPYDDAEARVLALLCRQGQARSRLGALLVETGEGLRFKLGGGFSDAQRAAPPAVGSLVTYRYNGLNASGVPRFARFMRVREAPEPRHPESRQIVRPKGPWLPTCTKSSILDTTSDSGIGVPSATQSAK